MNAPVAIVGAGPVGLTAALLLARHGVPSVLFDARAHREPIGSRSICQQREALDVWSSVGVGDRIAAEGVTWSRARTFHGDRELFCLDLGGAGWSPYPPFVNISQSRTEQILDEAVAAEPMVELRLGRPVTAITQYGDDVRLRTADGDQHASYAVLAAGGRADVLRDQLGVTFEGDSFDDRFLICDIRTDLGDWAEERRFYFDPVWNPGRQVLIHPCPDSTYRIDWQVPAGFDLDAEHASGALEQRIRAIIGDRPYDVVWQSVYRFSSRVASRMRAGRVLLAGDSAHVYSPFGARGLNSGVADADNLAWKLAYVLRGWAPDALLDSYHDERHTAALENLDVTAATMRFLIPPDGRAARYRRDVLERAGADPSARARVDSGRLSEAFWYDASPLTTPSPAHPCGGRPPRGQVPSPAPGVLVPDQPLPGGTRLRALARDGFLAIAPPDQVAVTAEGLRELTDAPSRAIPFDGALTEALGARPGETWLIRPDAYVAAVTSLQSGRLADPLAGAVRRALGLRP
ncbi:MAG TPA: FAD-dependent monooxygenase [Kribbellaceae bacterium]|nr:FAD-dependent monooxygenase [Kribbellaceae bacterium]